MNTVRYTDNNKPPGNAGDFVIRRRTPTILQLLLIFLAISILTISLTATNISKPTLGTILVAFFSAMGAYAAIQLQRSRDLVLMTEFQNALFASALGINNKFCLIIRQDGTIVYLNRSFQEMFPDFVRQSRRTVGQLLTYGNLSQEDKKRIFSAIEQNEYDKVAFDIHDSKGIFYRIIMSIEPILRPSGFILLRGREFVANRHQMSYAGAAASPINHSTITLFSYVMDMMDVGVYMTDPTGNFIYANPIFEQWLGFREGEMTSGNLSLKDIIYSAHAEAHALQSGNYEGNVTLQKKVGGLVQGFVNQKIIRNDEGKTIGFTALVHNVTMHNAPEQRKTW